MQNPIAPAILGRPGTSHAVVVGGGTMGADVAVVLTRAMPHDGGLELIAPELPEIQP